MESRSKIAQQVSKMRNQAFRILYDTLLETIDLSDEEVYSTLCLNLRRISNAKFAAVTIIDTYTQKPIASYGAYDEDMIPTCKPIHLKQEGPFQPDLINKCKLAQVRKCVSDEVCILKYYDEAAQALAAGKGECVGISCIQENKLYAAGLIKMPDGLPLKMADMLDNYLNLVSVLLSRIQALNKVSRSNQEMQRILSAINNVLIMIDENDEVIHWNHIAESLFNIKAEAAKHHGLGTLPIKWEWERIEKAIDHLKEEHETLVLTDITVQIEEGQSERFNLRLSPCVGDCGGIVLVGENSSDQRMGRGSSGGLQQEKDTPEKQTYASEKLVRSNQDLSKKIEWMLHVLLDVSEVSLDNQKDNTLETIRYIQSSLERGRNMIDSDTSGRTLDASTVSAINLNAALESAIDLTTAEWYGVAKVERHMRPDMPLFHGKANELNKVFVNLIRNATQAIAAKNKHTDKMGTIIISSELIEGDNVISIEDDGEGLTQEVQENIFQPFFTTRKHQGHVGQGLYLSRSYIKKYGGDIVCSSDEKGRTVFKIWLPRQE